MDNRPKSIEDAIKYLDGFDYFSIYQEAWNNVYDYIEQLENTIQELKTENKRFEDDGK